MTVKELREKLEFFENQGYGNLPIIYSTDDEGNAYHRVFVEPSLTQVHDIQEHYLEVVGHYDESSTEVSIDDVNCVTIN